MIARCQTKGRRLHELCNVTSSKRIFAADYQSEGLPFFRGKEIGEKHHRREVSTEIFISRDKFEAMRKKHGAPVDGDLLLTSIGALLGSPYVVDGEGDFYFKDGNLTWFRNFDGLESKFLYYWMLSPEGKAELEKSKIGSAQPAFTIANLKEMEISLPDLPTQRKIAGILSAYDDLIENNLRRIRILEEMAQSLYREWFVHFRFPGHKSTKMTDSPLGPIPEGWEVKKLGDIAEDLRRGIPKGELNEPSPYVGLEHIPRKSLALDDWETVTELGSNKLLFEPNEILFGKIRPYFHKVSVAPFHGICSADTIVIRAKQPGHRALTTACVSSEAFVAHASATANGAKMPRANWKVLIEYPLTLPPSDLLTKFSKFYEDGVAQQQALVRRNQTLRQTRDLLLPKLLSA